jgi:hypothetical protein
MSEKLSDCGSSSEEQRTFFDTGCTPSPDWAYTELWKHLVMMQDALNEHIQRLQLMENATPKTQRDLQIALNLLEGSARVSLKMLAEIKTS